MMEYKVHTQPPRTMMKVREEYRTTSRLKEHQDRVYRKWRRGGEGPQKTQKARNAQAHRGFDEADC